jgi:beta-glucosidase
MRDDDEVTGAGDGLDVARLFTELTLQEKASLLGGADRWHTAAIERLGIPAIMMADGPHGLRKQSPEAARVDSHDSYPATCFPPAVALASTWDVALLTRVGEALGDECRAEQISILLGPGVNMKRMPLCGRNFEYFSEDPFLAGTLGAAMITGVQSRGVGTSLKHFAANNQETKRRFISAEIDERTLREIYLPAFERVVATADPWTLMCSYNRINGVYSAENHWLLTDVLRDEWGFGGLVMSDWDAVNIREDGVAAGLDLEMPSSNGVGERRILDAVAAGTLSEADVDRGVARVLELVNRSLPALAPGQTFDADAHHALGREAAAESAVLLKNDGALLPLARSGGPVAVIGEFARTPRYQGAGSSQVNPTRLDDALTALRGSLSGAREVTFAPGFVIESEAAASGSADPALIAEAVEQARAAEVAVLFLGLPPAYESEGYDREHMNLPPQQIALVEAVAAVNPNVVVVLSNGAAVTVHPWQDKVRAVLEGWLLGQAGGSATADLLLGAVNPSGKLAETLPLAYEQNPTIGNFPGENGVVRYGEGLLIGYRWYDTHGLDVAYPFGHGLSYTTFVYSDLVTRVHDARGETSVEVSCTVTNTGPRPGREIVQVYVTDPQSSVFRPAQELKGFATVSLDPGASAEVSITLDARGFSFWNSAASSWMLEAGAFELRVGASSRDIRLTATIELAGESIVEPLRPDLPLGIWMDHPVGGPRLRAALEGSTIYDDYRLWRLRENPLIRVARMAGFPIAEQDVPGLAAEINAQAATLTVG